ncbi:MAG: helix-turn-helix domain-containing protein [Gemmatimonadota bacterium]
MTHTDVAPILELHTLEAFQALRSEPRLRLVEILVEPQTARDAAARLGVPVTRVYHHLNVLLEHGVVRVVETRAKRGSEERVFQLVGRTLVPSEAFAEEFGNDGIRAVGALGFRHAEARFLNASTAGNEAGLSQATVLLSSLHLTEARRDELAARLQELIADFAEDTGPGATSVFFAVHPMRSVREENRPAPVRGDE